jgi:hypothetical protein
MARMKTITRTVNMCGSCGKILANDVQIFDNCTKCGIVIEA